MTPEREAQLKEALRDVMPLLRQILGMYLVGDRLRNAIEALDAWLLED